MEGEPFLAIIEVLRKGPPESRQVFEVDLDERSLLIELSSYLDFEGSPVGTVIVLRDITQEKRNRQIKAAFMRMMIHELRSPVSTVMSFLAILKEHLLGEELSVYDDAIIRMSNRMNTLAQLINDILDIMRVDALEVKETKREKILLTQLIKEQLEFYSPQIKEKRLQVEMSIDPALAVVGDTEDLQRIFSNLISNAIKYNRDEGKLKLTAKIVNDMVEVDITDTGYGIRKENQSKIFSEFFREKKPETINIIGSGLGLSIVQRLCQRNAGRIRFTSEHMVGSTFTVSLPIIKDNGDGSFVCVC